MVCPRDRPFRPAGAGTVCHPERGSFRTSPVRVSPDPRVGRSACCRSTPRTIWHSPGPS